MRRVALFALVLLGSAVACSSNSSTDRLSSPSTTAATARDATVLAAKLGCGSSAEAAVDVGEPSRPTSARTCVIGEASFTVAVYGSAVERDAAMSFAQQFAGFRAVGPNWIVAADTPESAHLAADRLHGQFVELRGTAHG
jgi:hypothetical protein